MERVEMKADPVDDDLHASLIKRFTLWLAVGNGGGLIAVGARFPEQLSAPLTSVLFPSLWAFAIGLISAGLFNFILMGMFARQRNGKRATMADGVVSFLPAAASMISFAFGLLYPLVVLSIRYHSHGGFGA
jgi:uncharacterized membrane protein YdcZ (DUF606 family)